MRCGTWYIFFKPNLFFVRRAMNLLKEKMAPFSLSIKSPCLAGHCGSDVFKIRCHYVCILCYQSLIHDGFFTLWMNSKLVIQKSPGSCTVNANGKMSWYSNKTVNRIWPTGIELGHNLDLHSTWSKSMSVNKTVWY